MSQPHQTHPMFIMGEDTERVKDLDAQKQNIHAAIAVSDAVRTTLGPKGMDKMLVDSVHNVTVTNDGVTILKQMDIEHPTANLIVEVASTQENEAGDGTTTAVTLAGELLKEAQKLVEQGIHPSAIIRGFNDANRQIRDELEDIVVAIDPDDETTLRRVAETTMTGRSTDTNRRFLADLVIDAIQSVTIEEDGVSVVDREYVHTETQSGRPVKDSELIQGGVLDEDPVSEEMEREITDARMLLLDQPIEYNETEAEARISVDDPSRISEFLDKEERLLNQQIERIVDADANVVFCQKGIEGRAAQLLSKHGILAIQQVSKETIAFLKNALEARIVTNLDKVSSEDLGRGSIHRDESEEVFRVNSDSETAHGVTLLLRGSTEHIVDETERIVEDALDVVTQTVNDQRVLAGGGASEIEMAQRLRDYADSVTGREQLAINAFADSLEIVPKILAENAGLDPIDALIDLRSAHDGGEPNIGLNVFSGAVRDTFNDGVIEPAHSKTQAFDSATEVATLVLKIDDIIAAGDLSELASKGQEEPDQEEPAL